MSDSTPETLSSDERPERNWTSRRRRSSLGVATTGSRAAAMTTALSLVLVGGIATAAYRATQSSPAPDTLVPANAFAFGSVDLSLSGGQDSALRNFLDHFSASPTKTGSGSTTDRLLRALFKDSSDPHVDYDRDIKPWLGDHVAAAGWTDSSGAPQFEVLVQSPDTGRAVSTIKRLDAASGDNTTGVIASNGYVVVSKSTKLATEAIDDAKQKSLADNSVYSSDIKELPNGDPAVGWVDGAGISKLVHSAFGAEVGGTSGLDIGSPELALSPFGPFGGLEQYANAHLAIGLHAADNYFQLDTIAHGAKSGNAATSDLLTQLPGGTVAGIELGDPGSLVDSVSKAVSFFLGAVSNEGGFASGSSTEACVAAPLGQAPAHLRIPAQVRRQILHNSHLTRAERRAVLGGFRAQMRAAMRNSNGGECTPIAPMTGNYYSAHTVISPPQSPLDGFSQFTGLKFPDDVKTLLGDRAVITYGGLQLGSLPKIGIRSHPTDLQSAQQKAATLRDHLEQHIGQAIDVQSAANDLILASTPTYGDELAAKGTLGDSDAFRAAMGDLPSTVDVAIYVNIANILTTAALGGGDVPNEVKHIKSIGLWQTHSGDTQRAQFRFVVG